MGAKDPGCFYNILSINPRIICLDGCTADGGGRDYAGYAAVVARCRGLVCLHCIVIDARLTTTFALIV